MKTITISEFKHLLARNDWQHEQEHEVTERVDHQYEEWDHENESLIQISITRVYGWASIISTLDNIEITFTEGFHYDEFEPESLSANTEGLDVVWTVDGIVVVDEYGDEIDAHELADYLDSDFSSINYSVLEIEQVTDIDEDDAEDSDMEKITLEIDNAPSIRFTGTEVASAASSDERAMGSSYSGQTGRWTVLTLYKTKGGKYVCHQIGRTRWQGERDIYSGKVCETLEDVKAFFGYRWLAKELYHEAGIDESVDVE